MAYTLEKLALELRQLKGENLDQLLPLCIGIQSVLWPKESVETCNRTIQFMGFELKEACEGVGEVERWEILRRFFFENKGFQLSSARPNEVTVDQILVNETVEERVGHPFPVLFLLLSLAASVEIPFGLIQARHHFLIKWVRDSKTVYLDFYNGCRVLTDQELIQVINRSASNLETWDAKQLVTRYLELLLSTLERQQFFTQLHTVYDLLLNLDDTNTTMLGQRALLRKKLGLGREALCDLKRYFSFVERSRAPSELNQAWLELENSADLPTREASEILH